MPMSGHLPPCPRFSLNCVVSRPGSGRPQKVEPFTVLTDPSAAFARLKAIVAATEEASVVTATDTYLHAVWRSRLGFLDDVEFLLSAPDAVIHVRSASRVGLWDFNVNRTRVEALRALFDAGERSMCSR